MHDIELGKPTCRLIYCMLVDCCLSFLCGELQSLLPSLCQPTSTTKREHLPHFLKHHMQKVSDKSFRVFCFLCIANVIDGSDNGIGKNEEADGDNKSLYVYFTVFINEQQSRMTNIKVNKGIKLIQSLWE